MQKRLLNLTVPSLTELSGGEPVSFSEVQVEILPNNQVRILAKADLNAEELVPIVMTATLAVERRRRVTFNNPQFETDTIPAEQTEISRSLAVAFTEILNNMVDLDRFDLDGVTMRINRLETQGKQLVFSGYAQIERIPNTP
jgi:hypothetical protein